MPNLLNFLRISPRRSCPLEVLNHTIQRASSFVRTDLARIFKGIWSKVGAATGLSLVVVLTATLPVAYSSQELFGVENQIYWYEYDAVKRMSEHGVDSYTSDQRLGETGWRLFNLNHQ